MSDPAPSGGRNPREIATEGHSVAVALNRDISETEFVTLIVDLAMTLGWMVYHPRPARQKKGSGWATPMQGHKGFPDLVLAKEGRVIFAECKVGRRRLTDDQRAWRYHTGGQEWRPEDWPKIAATLGASVPNRVRVIGKDLDQ